MTHIFMVSRSAMSHESFVQHKTTSINTAPPKHPHDLPSHNGLFYQLYDIIHDVWEFSQDGTTYKIKMSGNRASNDGDLVRRWCVAGKGLAIKSCLDMSTDLLSENVVSIMPNFPPHPFRIMADLSEQAVDNSSSPAA